MIRSRAKPPFKAFLRFPRARCQQRVGAITKADLAAPQPAVSQPRPERIEQPDELGRRGPVEREADDRGASADRDDPGGGV